MSATPSVDPCQPLSFEEWIDREERRYDDLSVERALAPRRFGVVMERELERGNVLARLPRSENRELVVLRVRAVMSDANAAFRVALVEMAGDRIVGRAEVRAGELLALAGLFVDVADGEPVR